MISVAVEHLGIEGVPWHLSVPQLEAKDVVSWII